MRNEQLHKPAIQLTYRPDSLLVMQSVSMQYQEDWE